MQSILDPKWPVFIKVAELGSLTKAAMTMDVPQSMISRHINQLEQQCGARLFHRTGRGVVLTSFGEQMFPRISGLVAEAERIKEAILTTGGLPMGEVRVGMLPSSVPALASSIFSMARERFPAVKLHLSDGTSAQLDEQLRDGRIDMALLLREGRADGAETVLGRFPLQLVGASGSPILCAKTIALNALEGLPLVVPSAPHPLRARLHSLAEARGLNLTIAVEADSIRLQHEIAAAGGGFAITSGLFEMRGDPRLATAKIVDPELERCVVLATTLRRPHTLATREIGRMLVQTVPGLLRH